MKTVIARYVSGLNSNNVSVSSRSAAHLREALQGQFAAVVAEEPIAAKNEILGAVDAIMDIIIGQLSRGAYSPNKRAVAVAQAAYDALETLYERLAVACGKEQCKE